MKRVVGVILALVTCAAAQAAEPVASASAQKPMSARAGKAPEPVVAGRRPLDLRIRDARNYMTPEEFRAAIGAPDADSNTIVVQGTRLLPMESMQPIPGGLASLWFAAKHPMQAWRIFAPVVDAPAFLNYDKVPPPVVRLGP